MASSGHLARLIADCRLKSCGTVLFSDDLLFDFVEVKQKVAIVDVQCLGV